MQLKHVNWMKWISIIFLSCQWWKFCWVVLNEERWYIFGQPSIPVSLRASGLSVLQCTLCKKVSTLSSGFLATKPLTVATRDVKDHCITATHKKLLKWVMRQASVSKLFQKSSASEDVMRAEVMVMMTFLCSITCPWRQLITLYSGQFSW